MPSGIGWTEMQQIATSRRLRIEWLSENPSYVRTVSGDPRNPDEHRELATHIEVHRSEANRLIGSELVRFGVRY